MSYGLSEPLKQGRFTWSHVSGPPDPDSPHLSNLSGTELDSGQHADRVLSESPELVEGASYALTFAGMDLAGNASEPVVVDRVTYDTQAPLITLEAPGDSSYRNHTRISYALSEPLAEGTVTWTRTGGSPDNASPHAIALDDTALEEGSHMEMSLVPPPTLSDGAIYTVEISGEDRAGNRSMGQRSSGVVYDETPPILALTLPRQDSYVSTLSVSYELNETLKEAALVWNHTEGQPDPASPHRTSSGGLFSQRALMETLCLPNLQPSSVAQHTVLGSRGPTWQETPGTLSQFPV